MTKISLFGFILTGFLLLSFGASGQKVKYKDIFGLLSTKQYEQAEPFLKRYLRENDDNPNAYLFMGIILQEKALKMDMLKQTALVRNVMDSAAINFDKASKTIDDRELRKNKEYYEAYNRRDLRTGEFGVKLSDIQFDLEKKILAMRERIDKVKMVSYYFNLSDSLYRKSVELYKTLQNGFPSQRQLYLRSDEQTLKKIVSLSMRFDSCLRAFDSYKSGSSSLGRTGYNQQITLLEIKDLKQDGATQADFYQDDLKLWDFKKFAEASKEIIEKEIMPMRAHLITYDIEINKLREKVNNDSVSVRSDLTKLIDVLLYERLQKYDPEPLPMEVFSMKTADLEYRSSVIEHKPFRDSADFHLQLTNLATEMKYLHKLDSISGKLASEDIDQEAIDYGYFITNTYSNTIVLHSYIKAMHEFAAREKRLKDEKLARLQESLRWIVDGADSIPLESSNATAKFIPLHIEKEKYTVGLSIADSINADGYFYTLTRSRAPEVKIKFPVDKAAFKKSSAPTTHALTYSDPEGHIYYVLLFNETASNEKFPVTLAKIYRSDGLAWSNNYSLGFVPKSIVFKPETSELTVSSESQQTVIDKNGKLIK
jgi:hypothetical protein